MPGQSPDEPTKRRARRRLNRAVRDGEIERPTRCEFCSAEGRISGHHWHGYEDEHALDVQWLCNTCHATEHHRLDPTRLPSVAHLGGKAGGRNGGLASQANRSDEDRRLTGVNWGTKGAAKMSTADRSSAGRLGGAASQAARTPQERSDLAKKANAASRANGHNPGLIASAMRVECSCGMIASPGTIGNHIKHHVEHYVILKPKLL